MRPPRTPMPGTPQALGAGPGVELMPVVPQRPIRPGIGKSPERSLRDLHTVGHSRLIFKRKIHFAAPQGGRSSALACLLQCASRGGGSVERRGASIPGERWLLGQH